MSKNCISSRDYILLNGAKQLLNDLKWKNPVVITKIQWKQNKKIIEEYLEYIINGIEKKL